MGQIKDLYCRATDNLVQERASFFPLKIPVPHHQLRHFISTSEENRIYYAHKHDIYTLSLGPKQRCLLATVPFEARCLAADHGWICVGGEEKGDCAFLKIRRNGQAEALQDAFTVYGHPKCFGHDLVIKQLGGEIVNAMKIHKVPSLDSGGLEETMVLICNNDKTVKVYSLDQHKVLVTLDHPVAMNYACLSPDSNLLIAVGDANEVYFYKRQAAKVKSSSADRSSKYSEYRWVLIGTPSVPFGESIGEDFSFSVTFSPNGRLCAISSQGGYISIFNIAALHSLSEAEAIQDSLICSFKSFRPPLFGCVRSMCFSPEPWGLFAWAEDHGRAGIADVRQGFVRRQSLKLDGNAETVSRGEVEDTTPSKYKGLSLKERLKQQHLEKLKLDTNLNSLRGATEYSSDAWADELRRRQVSRLIYHQGLDLDARERSVLEAPETTMDEVEQSPDPSNPTALATRADDDDPDASEADSSWARNQTPDDTRRSYSRYHAPRRRSSVILSPSSSSLLAANLDDSRTRFSASPAQISERVDSSNVPSELPPLISTNNLTPGRQASVSQLLPYDIIQSEDATTQRNGTERSERPSGDSPSPSPSRYNLRRLDLQGRQEANSDLEAELESPLTTSSGRLGRPTGSTTIDVPSSLRPSLPSTTFVRRQAQEEARRRQMLHIESLERQVRRAENRVAITTSDIEALENAIVNGTHAERHARILEARSQARARAIATANASVNGLPRPQGSSSSAATAQDLERLRGGDETESPRNVRGTAESARRMSELSGRVSENDMRLARLMIMSGARQALDRNGNWVAVDRANEAPPVRPTEGTIASLIEDAVREMGPGTAGVGWSPNGRQL